MNKEEYLRILILLSQMEGFMLGKLGAHTMPETITKELSEICELLADKIKEPHDRD